MTGDAGLRKGAEAIAGGRPLPAVGEARRVRVLVVDDSAVVRGIVTRELESDPQIEVVGSAPNGEIALAKIERLRPDVLTLDVEMPVLDGMQTLRELRRRGYACRVVMFSTLTEQGGKTAFEALALGAHDCVAKPTNRASLNAGAEAFGPELRSKVKQFSCLPTVSPTPAKPRARAARVIRPVRLLAIGVSTGGPAALAEVLPRLPADFPCPIVITQHMPPMFTRLLAERLSSKSRIRVAEAQPGAALEPGLALIAPGGSHLVFRRRDDRVVAALDDGPPENSCKPSVDVMFRSLTSLYGSEALGVILTGMGRDGLEGARLLREAGGVVLAQDKASSVVWGMPGYVIEAGLADAVLDLGAISNAVLRVTLEGRL